MKIMKKTATLVMFVCATAAQADCVQEAMSVGENLGGAFCDETKRAYANDLVIMPRLAYQTLTCPDGSPFDYMDVLSCKRAMANETSRDRFCRRIFHANDALNYAGSYMTPRARYSDYQQRCNS